MEASGVNWSAYLVHRRDVPGGGVNAAGVVSGNGRGK